jgi:hypothetical protein
MVGTHSDDPNKGRRATRSVWLWALSLPFAVGVVWLGLKRSDRPEHGAEAIDPLASENFTETRADRRPRESGSDSTGGGRGAPPGGRPAPPPGSKGASGQGDRAVRRRIARYGLDYDGAHRDLGPQALPELFSALNDPSAMADWNSIVWTIGFLAPDGDVDAVSALVDFLIRSEDLSGYYWSVAQRAILAKAETLMWVGKIGGPEAVPILQSSLTEEGAALMSAAWADNLPNAGPRGPRLDRAWAIQLLRGKAAVGMAYLGDAEVFTAVERLYHEELARAKATEGMTNLPSGLVDAMAMRDMIQDLGFEGMLRVLTADDQISVVFPYIQKYTWPPLPPLPTARPRPTSTPTSPPPGL